MDGLAVSLAAIELWQRLFVACICLLGAEGPLLLFVAVTRRRAWWECALALAPVAGFAWALTLYHRERAAVSAWQSYLRFLQDHYSSPHWWAFAWQAPPGLQPLVNTLRAQTWEMGALTLALLIFGWVLLLRWRAKPSLVLRSSPTDQAATAEFTVEPIVVGERGEREKL
jgi:hypothetical protein